MGSADVVKISTDKEKHRAKKKSEYNSKLKGPHDLK